MTHCTETQSLQANYEMMHCTAETQSLQANYEMTHCTAETQSLQANYEMTHCTAETQSLQAHLEMCSFICSTQHFRQTPLNHFLSSVNQLCFVSTWRTTQLLCNTAPRTHILHQSKTPTDNATVITGFQILTISFMHSSRCGKNESTSAMVV